MCIADVDADALAAASVLLASPGPPVAAAHADVSQRGQVDAWIASIFAAHGRLDGAANVAGVIGHAHGIAPVADLDDADWHAIVGVNLTGTMYCLRAELRAIADGGSIINVSSVHGLRGRSHRPLTRPLPPADVRAGFVRHAAYDASKHGVVGLTRAAALENGEREVCVNSVAPAPSTRP